MHTETSQRLWGTRATYTMTNGRGSYIQSDGAFWVQLVGNHVIIRHHKIKNLENYGRQI